jgi:TonB family protein
MMLEALANAALRMLLVGAAAWLVLRIVRARNPHVEALVWRMLLLAGLLLPGLLYSGLAPRFDTLELPAAASMMVTAGAVDVNISGAKMPASLVLRLLGSIYLAVALLLVGRLAGGLVAMWRVSRAARPMPTRDDVRISTRIQSPATFGPVILLPAEAQEWPAERLDAVLAHERAHVRSRDGYWSWLAQLHAAIFWFNPLAWWLRRRLEALAETTSDDAVVAARHDPVEYAALLLDFARYPNSRSVVMSVAESNLSERIERLLARTAPASALPRAARWAALALLVPVVVLAASTTRAAPPAEPAASSPAPIAAASAPNAASLPPPDSANRAKGVLRRPANPDDYYPAVAKVEKVQGSVVVEVDVDALGQLVDARVVKVEPADPRFGFADAALHVARNSEYAAPSRQPSSLRFMVKFALIE